MDIGKWEGKGRVKPVEGPQLGLENTWGSEGAFCMDSSIQLLEGMGGGGDVSGFGRVCWRCIWRTKLAHITAAEGIAVTVCDGMGSLNEGWNGPSFCLL